MAELIEPITHDPGAASAILQTGLRTASGHPYVVALDKSIKDVPMSARPRGITFKVLRLRGRILGTAVKLLDVPAAAETSAAVWIQIAKAGTYKGHALGEFTFDEGVFATLIQNFRSHPSYKAGPDGKGVARVIPFDYEHASEADPTEGSIPLTGAPAPAWALELELRKGEDDTAELWALTELTEQAREQIRSGGYQWTSVAVWPNAIDPVSGKKVGPTLTSVAFTNHPFIKGMEPMRARVDVWGEAESPEELIIGLREILETAEDAPADTIAAELAELGVAYAEGRRLPGFPEGVGYLLDRVRQLIGARALSTADEIVQAAGQALVSAATSPSTTPADPAQPTGEPMTATNTNPVLLAQLAKIYGVRDKEEAVLAAAEQGQQATSAIGQLMELFGSSDTQGVLSKAAKAIEEAERAKELVTALQAANARLAEGDKKDAEAEVDMVAASMGLTGANKDRFVKVLFKERFAIAGDAAKLEAWRREYGVQTPEQRLLMTSHVAGPNGLQLGGPSTGLAAGNTPTATTEHPLEGYPGANRTLKAVEYLKDKKPGFTKLVFRDQVFQAGQYLRQGAPVFA